VADLSSILGAVSSGGTDLAVTVRSAVLPAVTVHPLAPSDGPPSLLLRILRPSVRVTLNGSELGSATPAGAPPAVPWVGAVLVLGGLAVLSGVFALGRATA